MIIICFLGIFCGLGRSQHLSRVPIAQVSITNPGERGLIPAQPYWPPSRPTLTTPRPAPTPPPVSPHTNAHLNEIESGVNIQDHGNRKTPEGARKSLPAVVLPIATHLLSFASLHSGMPEINLSQESRGEVQPSLLAHGQTSMPFQLPIINREQSQDHQLFWIKQAESLNAPEHTAQTENLRGKLSSGNVSTHSNVDHHGTNPHLKSSLSQLNFGGTNLPSVPHPRTSLSSIPRVYGAAVSHLVPVDEAGELPPLHHRSILSASQLHESDTLTPAPHTVPQSSPAAQFTITPHSLQDPFYYFNYPFNAFHNPIIGSQVPAVRPEQEAGAPHQVPSHPPSQLHHAPPNPQHQPQTSAHHLNVPQELPQQLRVHPLVIQTPQNHTQASVLDNKLLSSQLAKPITHKTDSPRSGDENLRGSLLLPDPKQFDEFGQVFEFLNQNIGKETIKINSNENNNDYDYYYDDEDYKEHTETPDKPPAATPTHPTNVSGRTQQQPHSQRHPTTRRSRPRKPITPPPSFIPPRPGHARTTHALNPPRPGHTRTTTRAHVHQDLPSMEGNHHPEDKSHPTRPLSSYTNTTRPSSVSSEDVTLGVHNISLGKPLNRLTSPLNKSRQSFSEQPAEPGPTTPLVRVSAPATITTSMPRQKSTKLQNLPPLYEPSTHSREGEGKLTLDGESQESTSNSTAPQKALNHRRRPVSVEIATIVGTGGHATLLASPEQLLKLQASREVPIQPTKPRQPVYFLPTEVGQQTKLAQRKRDVGHSSGSQQDIFIPHLRKRRPQRPQISSDESQPILRDTRLFAPPPNTKRSTLGKLFVPEYTQHNTQVKMGQINKADVDGQHAKTNTTRVHTAASNHTSGHWQRHILQHPVSSSRSESAVEGEAAAAGRHQPKLSSSFTRKTLVPSPSVAPNVTFLTQVSNKNTQLKYNREHNIGAGSSFHRLPLLGLTGEEALAQYKDLQDADPPSPSLDSLPPVLEKVVTAFPPFNRERVSIGADGMLRVDGWKKDMPYPHLHIPDSSLALSGLPFYIAQQHNLGPFFMVSL